MILAGVPLGVDWKTVDGFQGTHILVSDTVIPAPKKGMASQIQFPIQIARQISEVELELVLDYLNPSTRMFTEIPYKNTVLQIKKKIIKIPPYNGEEG